jgi:hypothetical protein
MLTPEERANGQYGETEVVMRLVGWMPSPEDFLYVPDSRLIDKLQEYKTLITLDSNAKPKTKAQASAMAKAQGELMEQVAALAFSCLKGWNYLKSYPSYAEQHDLVIGGNSHLWEMSAKGIMGAASMLTIVIEAKYLNKPLSSAQFTRLCYILQNKFAQSSSLGVFLSDRGATGMDKISVAPRCQGFSGHISCKDRKVCCRSRSTGYSIT